MGTSSLDTETKDPRKPKEPCWKEIIAMAFAGFCVTDLQLENMLDHLERMP